MYLRKTITPITAIGVRRPFPVRSSELCQSATPPNFHFPDFRMNSLQHYSLLQGFSDSAQGEYATQVTIRRQHSRLSGSRIDYGFESRRVGLDSGSRTFEFGSDGYSSRLRLARLPCVTRTLKLNCSERSRDAKS